MSVSGRVRARGPGFGVATFRFRRFLHLSEKKTATEVRPLFCYSVGTVKTTSFPRILGKTCFFPIIFQKRDLENPPEKMNPKFYKAAHRTGIHLMIICLYMSCLVMKANTQQELTTTILRKPIWDAVWELDENLFSCWAKHIFLFEKKDTPRFKPIELMYMIRGGIFCSWF